MVIGAAAALLLVGCTSGGTTVEPIAAVAAADLVEGRPGRELLLLEVELDNRPPADGSGSWKKRSLPCRG